MKSSSELKPAFVLACSLASSYKNGNQEGGLHMQIGKIITGLRLEPRNPDIGVFSWPSEESHSGGGMRGTLIKSLGV